VPHAAQYSILDTFPSLLIYWSCSLVALLPTWMLVVVATPRLWFALRLIDPTLGRMLLVANAVT